MTKADLIRAVWNDKRARESHCPRCQCTYPASVRHAARMVEATFDAITAYMTAWHSRGPVRLTLPGFGTFERVHRKARNGRDPRDGKRITIPAHRALVFRQAKEMRRWINEGSR